MNWIEAVAQLKKADQGFVIVTILSVEGSAPRDVSTKMVVDLNHIHDTIGGGNLEFQATEKARDLISNGVSGSTINTFTLGQDLTQCCGGKVELLFECFVPIEFDVILFGGGHVGSAIVKILSEISCRVNWIDSRPQQVEQMISLACSNVDVIELKHPETYIKKCPGNAYYLVMTHSHEQDMQIIEEILDRSDVHFCGLIGSKSKAAKFRNRLKRKQFSEDEIAKMTSPIGLNQVKGKQPMEVAVSVVGQLIELKNKIANPQKIKSNVDLNVVG